MQSNGRNKETFSCEGLPPVIVIAQKSALGWYPSYEVREYPKPPANAKVLGKVE